MTERDINAPISTLKPIVSARAYNALVGYWGGEDKPIGPLLDIADKGVKELIRLPGVSRVAAIEILDWINGVVSDPLAGVTVEDGEEKIEKVMKVRTYSINLTDDEVVAALASYLEKRLGAKIFKKAAIIFSTNDGVVEPNEFVITATVPLENAA